MAFENFATSVIAQYFQLVTPSGLIVGEFGPANASLYPNAYNLLFHHLDGAVPIDSVLAWSQNGTGNEYVTLGGPSENVGHPPMSVTLNRLSSSQKGLTVGNTRASLTIIDATDAGAGFSSAGISIPHVGGLGNTDLLLNADVVRLTNDGTPIVTASGALVQILGAGMRFDNQQIIYGKDTGGTQRSALYPRWSDNRLYMDGGAGFTLRVNDGATTVLTGETSGYLLRAASNFSVNGTCAVLGNNVLYFDSWGGGWFMQDGTWIRAYNDRNVYCGNGIYGTEVGIAIATGGSMNTSFGVWCSKPISVSAGWGGGNAGGGSTGGQGWVGKSDQNGNLWHLNWDGVALREYVDASLVKSFVIPHPDEPSKLLVHACLEAPTADVQYRGEGRLENGLAEIKLPDYFESLTELEGRTVQVTAILEPERHVPSHVHSIENHEDGSEFIVKRPIPSFAAFGLTPSLAVSRVSEGRFYVALGAGVQIHDCAFYWTVTAVRKGASFPVEPDKSSVTVAGDGPYTYLANAVS